MPKLAVVVPHHLAPDEALGRIKCLLGDLRDEHQGQFSDLRERWTEHRGDFSAKAMGFNLSGRIDVLPREVAVTGDLPFAAMPFKGRLEGLVRDRLERLLA